MSGCKHCTDDSNEILKAWGVSDSGDKINLQLKIETWAKKWHLYADVGLGEYDGRIKNTFDGYVEINYCPFCGRSFNLV